MSDIKVTIDAFRGMVGRHERVREDLTATNERSRPLAEIPSPMPDPATTEYITAACEAGRMHLDSVAAIEKELRARIDELKATADQYATTDQDIERGVEAKG